MDIDVDGNATPSFTERVLRYLETTVPDSDLTVLSRALLISSFGQANEAEGLLALTPLDLAHQATQCSAKAEPEWEHVGSLAVELCRDWLLFETLLADLHLDLFRERGPTRPPESFGRVYVPEGPWRQCLMV
ncbi:hypothetical protein COCOBI_08-0740 [Coccomyxa sp. Obi]|nr:hypothetical protein COCOBI_08-0740 [Coccomyxa sp. Obi]